MNTSKVSITGLILLVGGLLLIAAGTIFPSGDPVVALGWLLFFPCLVSLCGAVFVSVSMARSLAGLSRSATVHRLIGLGAVAGLGIALGYGSLGILSQVPDSLAGLNGAFVPGSAEGLSAFLLSAFGLLAGSIFGGIAALVWWSLRGRYMNFGAGEGT